MNHFARIKPQVLLSLTTLALAILPVTSTFAILPMAAEIFQPESAAVIATNEKTLTVDTVFSSENNFIIENDGMTTANNKNSANCSNNGKQVTVFAPQWQSRFHHLTPYLIAIEW